jgi:hypothetical protein
MNKFISRSVIYFAPLLFWAVIVYLIDPFNYWNISRLVDNTIKEENSLKLNPLLYRTAQYVNHPSENILVGDSRTEILSIREICEVSNIEYAKFTTNATKLNEMIDLVYLASQNCQLRRVAIGINFNMFNKYAYADRVTHVKRIMNNPLLYIYSKDVAEASLYVLRGLWTGKNVKSTPPMTRDEFWDWTIRTKGSHWYGKYDYPMKLQNQIIELDSFATASNIELVFIIVPHHRDFRIRLAEYELLDEEVKFKEMLSKLNSRVIDYDYNNIITQSRESFIDPVHYNRTVASLIISEIWGDSLNIGKEL